LSARDRTLARSVLKKLDDTRVEDVEDAEQFREVQIMLMLGLKAEIQAIDNRRFLTDWLDERL